MVIPEIGFWAKVSGRWFRILDFDDDKGTLLELKGWVCASKFENVVKKQPKAYSCPVCGAKILAERVDDGKTEYEVDPYDGNLIEITGWSNGYSRVYCSRNPKHGLDDIEEEVLDQI